MSKPPFGYFQPEPKVLLRIQQSRQLPPTWWGKQRAQRLRKKVMSEATLPMDLSLEGAAFRCYLSDNVSERGFVFMPWRFDQIERDFLLKHMPKEGVFVDVGANIGIYSCLVLVSLGEQGQVVAIEPNPLVADRLKFNLEATVEQNGSQAKVRCIECGVSDKEGTFNLYLDQDNLGASSLKASTEQSIEIQCMPLLDMLLNEKIIKVDAMKVDIEGAEDLALVPYLTQAEDLLLPSVLIFENNQNQWQLDVMSALKSRGYQIQQQTRMNFIFTRKLSYPKL